jgi:hypothetical protein
MHVAIRLDLLLRQIPKKLGLLLSTHILWNQRLNCTNQFMCYNIQITTREFKRARPKVCYRKLDITNHRSNHRSIMTWSRDILNQRHSLTQGWSLDRSWGIVSVFLTTKASTISGVASPSKLSVQENKNLPLWSLNTTPQSISGLVYFSGIFIPKKCGDIWGFGVHPILSNPPKYSSPKILYYDGEFLI